MKGKNKSEYAKLKSKIYTRFFALTAAAVIIVFVLYKLLWKNRGGDFVLNILLGIGLSRETASNIYQQWFRNATDIIWIAALALIFLIMLRFFMNWFTKYFTSINKGIDGLLVNDANKIILPPEMSATEETLNTVKTTLRQREREAREAERGKNDMITYLAHDIRTPLTSVVGYLSLIDESPDMTEAEIRKYVNISLDKSIQLEKLVNGFFEITKYSLNQIKLRRENTDIYYMLVQLADEFYPVLKKRGNSIELHADENLCGWVDAEKLARVFANIIKNAAAYSYPDTAITVDAEKRDGKIIVSFTNCGKTVPKEKIGTIFEKFTRIDESRGTDTGGAGLGLAIAKEIVTLHGGMITASSENEKTVFTVTIPD